MKHMALIASLLKRDLNLVMKRPAAENARSASTEVGGTLLNVSLRRFKVGDNIPLVSNTLKSLLNGILVTLGGEWHAAFSRSALSFFSEMLCKIIGV